MRTDAKVNRATIMQALTYYALYGAKNKFNNRLSDAEIESVTAKELVEKSQKT
nr:hypothetical protein [uncultured Porphyromonas sp.]